ncbi:MAG: ABC-three component system protein, partial [Candidatus Micrarchaeaceae archaeon]
MSKYAYENLSNSKFEELVVVLCQKLLGLATQGFASGPDGGRDAKFVGTAEHIPSKAAPWSGTVIIQAKHTNGYNKKFSDPDFFSVGSLTCVIAQETPRIKSLRQADGLDHYMLFSNRRLTGNAESNIRSHISSECGIPEGSILLNGIEQIEAWLMHFSDVPGLVNLDPIDSPLILSPDDLAEVVEAFATHRVAILATFDQPPVTRVSYEQKNQVNNMTTEYAASFRRLYLSETTEIKNFLAAPENIPLM